MLWGRQISTLHNLADMVDVRKSMGHLDDLDLDKLLIFDLYDSYNLLMFEAVFHSFVQTKKSTICHSQSHPVRLKTLWLMVTPVLSP